MKEAKVKASLKRGFDLSFLSRQKFLDGTPESNVGLLALFEILIGAGTFISIARQRPNWDQAWGLREEAGIPWGVYSTFLLVTVFLILHGLATLKKRRWALIVYGLFGAIGIFISLVMPMTWNWHQFAFYQQISLRVMFVFWMADLVKVGWKTAFLKSAKSGDASEGSIPA